MPTIQEIQCMQRLVIIILNPATSDAVKAVMTKNAVDEYLTHGGTNIQQVFQNFGAIESPVRLAIIKALPRTFGVLHEMGGHMMQFDARHRCKNHSFLDLVTLMERVEAFYSNTDGNFGYNGVIRNFRYDKKAYSWLHYYEGELDIEVRAERAHAKAAMATAGILVPVEHADCLIFSRRPSGTLVCRPDAVPEGNTVQEYVTNESGYMRAKLA